MQIIPLRALPNQSLTFTRDGRRWALAVKQAQRSMVVDVWIDDVEILRGSRIAPGTPVLPFRYLSTFGNLIFLTVGEADPDWRRFEADQTLLYVSPAEYPGLRAGRILDRVGAPLSAVQSVTTVRAGRIERDPLGGPDRLFDDLGNAVLSVRRLDGVMSHGWQGDVPLSAAVRSNLLLNDQNISLAPWGRVRAGRVFEPAEPSIGGKIGAWKQFENVTDTTTFYTYSWAFPPIGRTVVSSVLVSAAERTQVGIGGRTRDSVTAGEIIVDLISGEIISIPAAISPSDVTVRKQNGRIWRVDWQDVSKDDSERLLAIYPASGGRTLYPGVVGSGVFIHGGMISDDGQGLNRLYFPAGPSRATRVDYGFQSGELRVNWDDTLFTSATWSGSGLIWGANE